MVRDRIADLIHSIRNASVIKKESFLFPYSKQLHAIALLLVKEGYVKAVAKKGKKINKYIELQPLYLENKTPRVRGVERVSHLSKRTYQKVKDLRPVANGYGLLVLSSTKGIISDADARKMNVGGEALFKIW